MASSPPSDDWSAVQGVQGYKGDGLATGSTTDPQSLTADGASTETDVIANSSAASTSGGVHEIDGDAIALQGSGSANAPHLVFHLDLTGTTGTSFAFDARDLDVSDTTAQQIAVQYRVGVSGDYTNLPAGYIADATADGSATLVTSRDVTLPAATDGASDVFVRVITADAPSSDGMVGIDNIVVGEPAGGLTAGDPADVTTLVDEPISPIELQASGGTKPYTWEITGLPPGLSEASDGRIEGTPTETGTSTVTATVTDSATPNAATDTVEFTITVEEPAAPVTIAEIQGTTGTSPMAGETVTTRGVVTAAYPTGGFFGFVIQTEGTGAGEDATPGRSDALWVFQSSSGVDVESGQFVELTGVVSERFGRTQLTYDPTDGPLTVLDEDFDQVAPLATEWFATEGEREAHESELVDLSGQAFTVSNNYATNRFGEIGLAAGERQLITPTEVANPSDTAEYDAVVADNFARGVILDDGASADYQNNDAVKGDPLPWIDREITARIGADATLTGPVIVDYGFNAWRLQPTSQVNGPEPDLATFEDTRPDNLQPQAVGGDLKLATFNVLNYFTTTGMEFEASELGACSYFYDRAGDEVTNNRCNPDGPRGAAEDDDLTRQQAKIVSAINALDASVVSLEEIENSAKFGKDRDNALGTLTEALNAEAGSDRWAFVPSPPPAERPASEDVIRTAFIYDPAAVELVDDSVIFDDPAFSNARQPLAQAFAPAGATDPEAAFAVIVNHFKSKGSACTGEPNGPQGNCNESRVAQAQALVGFAEDFAAMRDLEQTFLTGDFNAYSEEDPMMMLEQGGFTQLKSDTADEWSYSFDGMSGSLDHVLANDAALANVTGVDIWESNANEALAFEYSRFNYNVTDFYAPDVFRASDHNPEVVGIDVPAPRQTVELDIKVKPGKVEAGKTRPRLEVEVEDNNDRRQPVSGVIRVSFEDEVRTETLRRGEALFELGTFDTPGTVTVTVEYLGSDTHRPRTETFTFEVRSKKD